MSKFVAIMVLSVAAFLAAGGASVKLQVQPVTDRHKELYLPLQIQEWRGAELLLNEATIAVIQPDSYLYSNYRRGGHTVNVYVGYYGSLQKSDAAHIPSLCYPAQGWRIMEEGQTTAMVKGRQVPFARLKVRRGSNRELVYYGFKTSTLMTGSLLRLRTELAKKALLDKETENALVRFSMPLPAGTDDGAERAMLQFIGEAYPLVEKTFGSTGNDSKATNL